MHTDLRKAELQGVAEPAAATVLEKARAALPKQYVMC